MTHDVHDELAPLFVEAAHGLGYPRSALSVLNVALTDEEIDVREAIVGEAIRMLVDGEHEPLSDDARVALGVLEGDDREAEVSWHSNGRPRTK